MRVITYGKKWAPGFTRGPTEKKYGYAGVGFDAHRGISYVVPHTGKAGNAVIYSEPCAWAHSSETAHVIATGFPIMSLARRQVAAGNDDYLVMYSRVQGDGPSEYIMLHLMDFDSLDMESFKLLCKDLPLRALYEMDIAVFGSVAVCVYRLIEDGVVWMASVNLGQRRRRFQCELPLEKMDIDTPVRSLQPLDTRPLKFMLLTKEEDRARGFLEPMSRLAFVRDRPLEDRRDTAFIWDTCRPVNEAIAVVLKDRYTLIVTTEHESRVITLYLVYEPPGDTYTATVVSTFHIDESGRVAAAKRMLPLVGRGTKLLRVTNMQAYSVEIETDIDTHLVTVDEISA